MSAKLKQWRRNSMSKTYLPKTDKLERKWYELDAADFTLGRLASKVAQILTGKHKANFTPHLDTGDFVVVKNMEKIQLTGRKIDQKKYHSYSGFPGGITTKTMKELLEKNPARLLEKAVMNMLPKTRLRKPAFNRLKIVVGDQHDFQVDNKIKK